MGTRVEARWLGGVYFPGVVDAVPDAADGSGYRIRHDDGDIGVDVPRAHIRLLAAAAGGAGGPLQVGARVEARWHGGVYFPGVIEDAPAEGGDGYRIHHDDGDIGVGVPREHIRLLPLAPDGGLPPLAVGTRVEARWHGVAFFPGVVEGVPPEGGDGYRIHHDDGDIGVGVPRAHIRLLNTARPPRGGVDDGGPLFGVGARVEARWRGGGFFPGVVTSVNEAARTYGIAHDDGDVADAVPHAHVRPLAGVAPPAIIDDGMPLEVGARVQARYMGGAFYPGVITAVHPDGSYDLTHDDGDLGVRVPRDHIRSLAVGDRALRVLRAIGGGGGGGGGGGDDPVEVAELQPVDVGARVQAKWMGGAYFPGRITARNPDGTYVVTHEDGGA